MPAVVGLAGTSSLEQRPPDAAAARAGARRRSSSRPRRGSTPARETGRAPPSRARAVVARDEPRRREVALVPLLPRRDVSSNVPMSSPSSKIRETAGQSAGGQRRRSSQLDRAGHGEPLEEPPVVGDDDQAALVGLERRLELLDRLEVEVVRRLVEDQAVDARAPRAARGPRGCARRARARAPGGSMSSGPRANFASSVRASVGGSPDSSAKSSRRTPAKRSRAWVSSPKTTAGADAPRAARERQLAGRARGSASSCPRRLPRRPPGGRRTAARGRPGPSVNEPTSTTAPASSTIVPVGGAAANSICEPPRRPRLLDLFEPLEVVAAPGSPCRAARSSPAGRRRRSAAPACARRRACAPGCRRSASSVE